MSKLLEDVKHYLIAIMYIKQVGNLTLVPLIFPASSRRFHLPQPHPHHDVLLHQNRLRMRRLEMGQHERAMSKRKSNRRNLRSQAVTHRQQHDESPDLQNLHRNHHETTTARQSTGGFEQVHGREKAAWSCCGKTAGGRRVRAGDRETECAANIF